MKKPRVCVVRTAGTNCDRETVFAFQRAGALPERIHINRLISGKDTLDGFSILAVPGGFSYGDDLGAGKILANELKYKLFGQLKRFLRDGKLIIGICNGFQILVKSGLLPGNVALNQEASLIINDCAKFEARWVHLTSQGQNQKSPVRCVWTKDLPEMISLPVAHGEGKFIVKDNAVLKRIRKNGQIVFQYCDEHAALAGYPHNPNGSIDNIAGICDGTGRILGLMPHPERYIFSLQHPRHISKNNNEGDGLSIFKNGVEYARRHC
jgi:phosphoribosylformylglycinamidine synthase I